MQNSGNKPPYSGHAIQYADKSTYHIEPFDDEPVGVLLDADEVAKACCDIAWYNGWVLTYKFEKRK
jgi:hypothetical protein